MEFHQLDKFSVSTRAGYSDVVERVKTAIAKKGWSVTEFLPATGALRGKGRYGLNKFDFLVQLNALPDGDIRLQVECGFSNAVDLFGVSEKKAQELLNEVVQGNWGTVHMPPLAFPSDTQGQFVAGAASNEFSIAGRAPATAFGQMPPPQGLAAASGPSPGAVTGNTYKAQNFMPYVLVGGFVLLVLVLVVAVNFPRISQYLAERQDREACEESIPENRRMVAIQGGEENYIVYCMPLMKILREAQTR